MNIKRFLLVFILFVGLGFSSRAQLVCPPNIDFELGDLTGWTFFVGTFSGGTPTSTTPSAPIVCRHTLTKSTGLIGCTGPGGVGPLDQYGGFPVVAPGGGGYSLRVGNNVNGRSTEKARFYIQIPPGSDKYSLIYRYAVVFENPLGHDGTKPQFVVTVFDSAATSISPGGTPVLVGDSACSYFQYVAGSVPGFLFNTSCPSCSPVASAGNPIQYKSWATATVDLSGLAGTTVGIDFMSVDCGLGGHFGYGYIDMSCGLFRISATICDTLVWPVLTAPDGFAAYDWYDSSTFSTYYGSGMTITIPFPSTPITMAVILTPLPGYGCPDTLYTTIRPANLVLHPSNDTAICRGRSVLLETNATDIALPLSYVWAPAAGLSCTTCPNPVATPTVSTAYTVVVTNANGCTQSHVYQVDLRPDLTTNITFDTPTCHGYTNGWATAHVTTGQSPYTFTWSTAPVQTDSAATGLGADTFSVIVFDAFGCTDTTSVILKDPDERIITIDTFFHPSTCLGANGSIEFFGNLVPDTAYTISYLFNGIALTQVDTADATSKIKLRGLSAGTYSNITIILAACVYNIVGPIVLVDPPTPDLTGVTSNSFVCVDDILELYASSTATGVAWYWEGPGGFTSGLPNPTLSPATLAMSGVYSVTVSKASCFNYATTLVEIRPLPTPVATSNTPVCSNDTLKLYSTSSSGFTSFVWNGPNFFNSFIQNPYVKNVQTASTGIYTVAITLNGCTVSDTVLVTVNQTPSAPAVMDTNYCENDIAVEYFAVGTNKMWYTSATGGIGDPTTPIPSTVKHGIYPVYVTQTTDEGCTSGRSMVKARVWTYPEPYLEFTDSVSCAGKYITFNTANIGEGGSKLTWKFEPTDSIVDQNPVYHAFNTLGTFTLSATAYYTYCPTMVLQKVISIFPYPAISLGPDTTICPGSMSIKLSAANLNTFGYPVSWKWASGETTPSINIVAPGIYRATVTINGCSNSDSIVVSNDCYINVPNVFTPNGDGVNDYFFPRQLLTSGLIEFDMNIYNRWGQLIFSANALDGRGWDGKLNGVPQPEGVYIYLIDAKFKDGQRENHKGNVTLLR